MLKIKSVLVEYLIYLLNLLIGQIIFHIELTEADESEDIHICGLCKTMFGNVDLFMQHKKSCAKKKKKKNENSKNETNNSELNLTDSFNDQNRVAIQLQGDHLYHDQTIGGQQGQIQENTEESDLIDILTKKDEIVPGIHRQTNSFGNEILFSHSK